MDRVGRRNRDLHPLRGSRLLAYNATVSIIWVAIGGAAGSVLRYWVSHLLGAAAVGEGFPWATFTVNVVGSLGLGMVFVLGEGRTMFGADARVLLGTGVMGGFTTYSAFNLESLGLLQNGAYGRAALYMGGTVVACLIGGAFGLVLGRAIRG